MNKKIVSLLLLAVIGLAGCDTSTPSGNITSSQTSSIASTQSVVAVTTISYDEDNVGTEYPTTTFPVNKYVYLNIRMELNNPSTVNRNVSATITIPNSEDVTFQPSGNTTGALPVCTPTTVADGGRRTTCTNMEIALESLESFTRTYTFRLLGFREGEYRLQVAYNTVVRVNDRIVERAFNFEGYLPVHPTPIVSIEDDRIVWTNSQASIIKYEISIDDTIVESNYDFNYYSLASFEADVSFKFSVRTKSDFYAYSTSNEGVLIFQKLNAPVITITDGVIEWEPILQADKYIVRVGATTVEVSETRYVVGFANAGTQNISVAASSSFGNVARSEFSSPLEVTKLEAPILRDELVEVVWDAVVGATSYDIYVNDILVENTTNLFHSKISSLNADVYVIAKSSLNHVIDSNPSNVISYLIG
jgi:hypothetical protein